MERTEEAANSFLDSGKSVEEHLEPREERETLTEKQVGVPGLNAYRTIEQYEEEGCTLRERRTELRILGIPITLDYGEREVKKEELETP